MIDVLFCWATDDKRKQVSWPSGQQWLDDTGVQGEDDGNDGVTPRSWLNDFNNRLPFYVDGTYLPVKAASCDPPARRKLFSHKHGRAAFTYFVIVTHCGRIVYVSSVQHGSVHDQTHFYKDDVPWKLRHRYGK